MGLGSRTGEWNVVNGSLLECQGINVEHCIGEAPQVDCATGGLFIEALEQFGGVVQSEDMLHHVECQGKVGHLIGQLNSVAR